MSDRPRGALQRFAWPNYLVAILLILLPLLDLVTNVWPVRPGTLEWRYGTLGLLSGFTLTPLLGMVLATASAALLDHRVVQRAIGIVNLLAAVAFAVVVVLFALDWLQMRAAVQAAQRQSMDVGALKALAKHVLVGLALGWLGIVGLRASRREPGAGRRRSATSLMHEPRAAPES